MYKLDETNKICVRDTGKWCFNFQKHGTAYKKNKNQVPVMEVVNVYHYFREEEGDDEMHENWKSITKEIFKHHYINSNKLQKINEIVKEGVIVKELDCYWWKCTILLKSRINNDLLTENVFMVVVGIEKKRPIARSVQVCLLINE